MLATRQGIRSAPSRRMVVPFSMGFSTIWRTMRAYSWGLTQTRRVRSERGQLVARRLRQHCHHRRVEDAGAMVMTRICSEARSRATGSVKPTTPPLDAA